MLSFVPIISSADLGIIIVTPTIIEIERESSATPITVIDEKTIEQSGANNLAELLRGQAGLHVTDLFGDGNQATIDLRGFGPTAISNTLILIDGRRLNNSSDASVPDLSTIDLEDIKQIEILQGSGGVLYGNQAVGGVVNIITKKVVENKTKVKLEAGSFSSSKVTASIRRIIGDNRLSVVASDSSSDNYRDHNQHENQRISVKVSRQFQKFIGYIKLEKSDDNLQTPGALLQAELDASRTQSLSFYSGDYFNTQTDLLQIGFDIEIDDTQSFDLNYSNRISDREFIQTFRPFAGTLSTQDRDTQTLAGKYILKLNQFDASSVVFGFNLEQTDYELLSAIGLQAIDQAINDLYAVSNWNISNSRVITAGVRYSDQQAEIAGDNFDDAVSVISLGFNQRIGDWKLNARADQNFRYPTVDEHTNVPFGQNPGLKTQEGISYEFSAEFSENNNRFRATVYSINLDNEIAFDSSGFSNVNLDSTNRQGLILEGSRQWSEKFSTNISITLLDAEITDGAFKGKNIPLVPEETLRLDGSYQYNRSYRLNLEFIAVGEQNFGGDFANSLGKLDSYNVVNFNMINELKQWELAFRINNLLDEEYSESGSLFTDFSGPPTDFESFFPSPERNFWFSVKYTF